MRRATVLVGALVLMGVLGACASPEPPSILPTLAVVPSTSPSPPPGAPVSVAFAGEIHCDLFPYSCGAYLSVVPPDSVVDGDWRPAASDPWWLPDRSGDPGAGLFEPVPIGTMPALAPGRHRLVMSLLGRSDLVSYAPDGSIATDLLSRCTADVNVMTATPRVSVLATFTPDGVSHGGPCTLEVAD
jgi:hypothetical protein